MYLSEENKNKLMEVFNKEVSKILEHGELNKDTLHSLYEIVDVLKDMCEIEEKDAEGGYSTRRYPHYSYNNYDHRGNSYNRPYNSYGSDRDRMMDEFMNQATTERERDLVRRIMNSM